MSTFVRITAAISGLAGRVHRRTERMPRLPFLIALAVSAVLLAAAVESAPGAEERITDVDELSLPSADEMLAGGEVEGVEADLEIVEYGFGIVTDPNGRQLVSLGAILRNPGEQEVSVDSAHVRGLDPSGEPRTFDDLFLGIVPPESEMAVGVVLRTQPEDADLDSLEIDLGQATAWEYDPEWGALYGPVGSQDRPEVALLDAEPLVAPEGHRLNYEITIGEEGQYFHYSVSVVFRDEDGRIVGGIPGYGNPFQYTDGLYQYRSFPTGTSVQHIDLTPDVIPPGADLTRTEIGASA